MLRATALKAVHPWLCTLHNRHFTSLITERLIHILQSAKHYQALCCSKFLSLLYVNTSAVVLLNHGVSQSRRILCALHSPCRAGKMPPPLCQHPTSVAAAPACARAGRVPELVPS